MDETCHVNGWWNYGDMDETYHWVYLWHVNGWWNYGDMDETYHVGLLMEWIWVVLLAQLGILNRHL
ncbi:hypothetical protein HanRHA438_Chr15g0699061 [Helianthus annuus]|nr:hypothetical protein HanRHA438_Chr15g0699061 [Helianthus annuus]